jgi:hypothetical protein
MFRLKNLIVSAFLALSCASVFTSLGAAQEALPTPNVFLAPNEVNPELIKSVVANSPEGAYATVGTERGFIQAALAPHITDLYFLDREAGTVLYNDINTELLRASWQENLSIDENRLRYVHYRLEATFEEWQKTGQKLLSEQKNFDWFTKSVRGRAFHDFNTPPKNSRLAAFRNANYLYDDRMFGKIQKMALDGKIHSLQLDLGSNEGSLNKKGVQEFLTLLEQRKTPLAVFDLSNAWSRKYLGPQNTAELVELLAASPVTTNDSVFVITDYRRNQFYKNGERAKAPWFTTQAENHDSNAHYEYDWEYHGYTFDFLSSRSFLKILNSSLPKGSSLDGAVVGCDELLLNP